MNKKDVELSDILQTIKESINNGYELELSIDYNGELKDLPDNKLYTPEEVKNMDYIKFISEIYNHFRSIEKQQLYEFKSDLEHYFEEDVSFHYRLCAMRPFGGDAGYKYGGGSGTFSMRIFLTQRKLLLQQLSRLFILSDIYEEIGIDFIKNEHPFCLDNISTIMKYIKDTVYKNIIGKLIDEKYYDIEQRRITLEELKESVVLNIQTNNYELNNFEIIIEEDYGDLYFTINDQYLGRIIKLVQRKEVKTEYYLDIESDSD